MNYSAPLVDGYSCTKNYLKQIPHSWIPKQAGLQNMGRQIQKKY